MKKNLLAITFATAIFASCNSNPKTTTDTATTIDTTNRTALDKAMPLPMSGGDTVIGADGTTYVKVNPNQSSAVAQALVAPVPAPAPPRTTSRSTTRRRSSGSSSGSGSSSSGSGVSGGTSGTGSSTGTVYTEPKKKGWSSAAKGAVIGGATGAVAGAIIDKKRGRGAVIGGLVGAGGGYIIGKSKDNKAAGQ
jgi:hypothetical protein